MTADGAERFEIPGAVARVIRGEVRLAPDERGSVVLVHAFKGFEATERTVRLFVDRLVPRG